MAKKGKSIGDIGQFDESKSISETNPFVVGPIPIPVVADPREERYIYEHGPEDGTESLNSGNSYTFVITGFLDRWLRVCCKFRLRSA